MLAQASNGARFQEPIYPTLPISGTALKVAAAPAVLPSFETMISFADEPQESWQKFTERWEVDMLTLASATSNLPNACRSLLRDRCIRPTLAW